MTKKQKKATNRKRIQKQTRTEQRRAGVYRKRS